MMQYLTKKINNKKGFTLIELIVVIAILAILALLAVPRFLGTLENSRYNTHNANVRTIESAISVYAAETGIEADTVSDINLLIDDYLKEVPDQPVDSLNAYTVSGGVVLPGLYEKSGENWVVKTP